MNKKELRYAFNTVLELADNARCDNLHHNSNQWHSDGEVCPVEYKNNKQAHIIREYMKANGI